MLTPLNPMYADAINRSHRAVFKIEVLDGLGRFLDEISHLDGSVSATLGSQVTRNAELLLDPKLSPKEPGDLLYPAGNRIRISRGIDLGCGGTPEMFTIFHGRINTIWENARSPLRLNAVDLTADIRDAGFTVPETPNPNTSINTEFRRIVSGALGSATFGVSDSFANEVGERSWDTDRSQALDDLANSVSAFWYTLANGDFVMRRVPWTISRAPVLTFTDGLGPAGCGPNFVPGTDGLPYLWAADSTRERSREQVFNVITVAAEHVNGQVPIVATASDGDPTSPTWIGGNFGIKSRHVRTDVALTESQVRLMARGTLRRSKAFTDSWSLQTMPDGRLELGDCVRVACQRVESIQIIAAFRIPLSAKGRMDIGTRGLLPELVDL